MKKYMKSLQLMGIALFVVFTIGYLYKLYDIYYGYTDDFRKIALTQGYSQLAYYSEYYQIYENDLNYLILVKGNSNHYIVQKSAGLSRIDLTGLNIIDSKNWSSLYLVPSAKLVGNSRVTHLNGYLLWRFINDQGEIVYIDYFIEK